MKKLAVATAIMSTLPLFLFAQLPSTVDLASGSSSLMTLYGPMVDARLGSNEGGVTFLDFNGDGEQDILIGAYRARLTGQPFDANGRAYVVLGDGNVTPPRNLLPVAAGAPQYLTIIGDDVSGLFGAAVAAGDLNGDGRDDAVIAAPLADRSTDQADESGEVVVLYGGYHLDGQRPVVDLQPGAPTTTAGETRILGAATGWQLGFAVAVADVNGDGFDDLIAGAPYARTAGTTDPGQVVILFGSASRIGTPAGAGTLRSLQPGIGASETRIYGADSGGKFGYALATGDVNGDGIDDIAIGAPDADSGAEDGAGSVTIIYGSTALANRTLDLSRAAGTYGETRILGDDGRKTGANGDRFGQAVALGDRNGDGLADLVVGAPQADRRISGSETDSDDGELYLLQAKSDWPGRTVSMNTNGAISAESEVRLAGAATADFAGWAVTTPDMDGDGRADVFATSALADPLGRDAGGDGVLYLATQLPAGTTGTFANPVATTRFYGPGPGQFYGHSLAFTDYNRDGFDDLMSTAVYGDNPAFSELSDANGDRAGSAYLAFGAGAPTGTASAVRYNRAGDGTGPSIVPPTDFGAAPRLVLDYPDDDNASASRESVTLTRGPWTPNPAIPGSHLPVQWRLTSNRSSASVRVTVSVTDGEIGAVPKPSLRLFWLASGSSAWELAQNQAFDPLRNRFEATLPRALGQLAIGSVAVPYIESATVRATDVDSLAGTTRRTAVQVVLPAIVPNGGTASEVEISTSPTFASSTKFPAGLGPFAFDLGSAADGNVAVYTRILSPQGLSLAVRSHILLDRVKPLAVIESADVTNGGVADLAEYLFKLRYQDTEFLSAASNAPFFTVTGATWELVEENTAAFTATIRLRPASNGTTVRIEIPAGRVRDSAGNVDAGAAFQFLHDDLPPHIAPGGALTAEQEFANPDGFTATFTVTFSEPIQTLSGSLRAGLLPAAITTAGSTVTLRNPQITVARIGATDAGPWRITTQAAANGPGKLVVGFLPNRIFDLKSNVMVVTGITAETQLVNQALTSGWRLE